MMNNPSNKSPCKAKWIWARGPFRGPLHFALFRKTFITDRSGIRARISCAADSKYRLWLNGKYIGFGPARGNPESPYCDTRSVALRKGKNTAAFLVEHYSPAAHRFTFAAVAGGLWCQLKAGKIVLAATDRSWKAQVSKDLSGLPGRLFPECFDARLEPENWQEPLFDDSRWPAAVELLRTQLAPPVKMLPRPIPFLTEKRLAPRRIIDAGICLDKVPSGGFIESKDMRDLVCADLWPGMKRTSEKLKYVTANVSGISAGLWHMRTVPAAEIQFKPPLKPPCSWPRGPVTVQLRPCEAVYIVIDFGMETLAAAEISVRCPAGTIVDFGCSECLRDNRVATQWQLPLLGQCERIITREGLTRHRFSQPRGFRYMVIRLGNPTRRSSRSVTIESLAAYEMIYPARKLGAFSCSDPLLNRIFALSARTINLCMEDSFTDCPWRERSQWVGDVQPEALGAYYCFGEYALARKAVLEFAGANTPEGWVPGVVPTRQPSNLPTWGMRWPVLAWEYYLFSGDRASMQAAYQSVKKQMHWFAQYENRDNLLEKMPGWNFVDWTRVDSRNADGAVQGWYLEALEASARLARAAEDKASAADYMRRAARLRRALARLYWSPAGKAFRKYRPDSPEKLPGTDPEMIGQHENFLFYLLKIGRTAQRRLALDAMRGITGRYLPNLGDYQSYYRSFCKGDARPGQDGNYIGENLMRIATPFWSYFAISALMEAGRTMDALEYMRLCWGLMLEFGATSCWERWERQTSLCHGWSAAPAIILPAYVLGIRPRAPGFRRFDIRPQLGDLTQASGRVPTPAGTIHAAWRKEGATWQGQVRVPRGLTGQFLWDRSNGRVSSISVDGRPGRERDARELAEGDHTITVRYL